MTTNDELQAENVANFIANGPGLRTSYNTWIDQRDPDLQRVRLCGLGAMGVGTMWVDEDDRHRSYPGYETATLVDSSAYRI